MAGKITTPQKGMKAIQGSVKKLKELFHLLSVRMVDMENTNDRVIEFLERVKPQTQELDGTRIGLLLQLHVLKAGNTQMGKEQEEATTKELIEWFHSYNEYNTSDICDAVMRAPEPLVRQFILTMQAAERGDF